MTLQELCGYVVQFVQEQPTEGAESWRDRLDKVLADVRGELATANDDEEPPNADR